MESDRTDESRELITAKPRKKRRTSTETTRNLQEGIIDLTFLHTHSSDSDSNGYSDGYSASYSDNGNYSDGESESESNSDSESVGQSNESIGESVEELDHEIGTTIHVQATGRAHVGHGNSGDGSGGEAERAERAKERMTSCVPHSIRKFKIKDDNSAESENSINVESMLDDDETVPPSVGALYKKGDGTVLGVRLVDIRKRWATCQEFIPSETKAHGRYENEEEYVTVSFKQLPSRCLVKDWSYVFDPEIKHEFSISRVVLQEKIELTLADKRRNRKSRQRGPRTLELFAGAGGMSQGLLNAGMDIRWAVEKNVAAAGTLGGNLGNGKVFRECVYRFLKGAKRGSKRYPKQDEVDHIHASPPCQGVSRANRYGGKNDESNNQLSFSLVKAVRHFKPKTFTYENVMGLATKLHREMLFGLIADLCSLQYQIRLCVLNASDYGDAQARKRIVIFASDESFRLPPKPQPTHGYSGLHKKRTVKDAIGILADIEATTVLDQRTIEIQGIKIDDHCARRSSDIDENHEDNTKLSAHRQAPTAMSANRFIHYKHHRYLSVREYACLQSFPCTWSFMGSEGEKFRQIGNAVPVHMATSIARSVVKVHGNT
ncbi:MAG: hypothetical protein SGBAC_002204 [Bacillariaceae sp.]